MLGALKMAEQLKDMPPWAAVLIVLVMIGGAGSGGWFGLQTINQRLDQIDKNIVDFTRKVDSIEWRVVQNQSRIDGQASKNREQDRAIRLVENKSNRIETIMDLRSPMP